MSNPMPRLMLTSGWYWKENWSSSFFFSLLRLIFPSAIKNKLIPPLHRNSEQKDPRCPSTVQALGCVLFAIETHKLKLGRKGLPLKVNRFWRCSGIDETFRFLSSLPLSLHTLLCSLPFPHYSHPAAILCFQKLLLWHFQPTGEKKSHLRSRVPSLKCAFSSAGNVIFVDGCARPPGNARLAIRRQYSKYEEGKKTFRRSIFRFGGGNWLGGGE